jgi:glucose/arabinose dehydrogenase
MTRRIALVSLIMSSLSNVAEASIPAVTTEHVATIPASLVTFITQSPLEGDERLFIGSQRGEIFAWSPGQLPAATQVLDISGFGPTGGEWGLFSMAFHPQFGQSNWFLFLNHTVWGEGTNPRWTALARYEMREDDRSAIDEDSRTVVYLGNSGLAHNAGDIHFGPDGYLYIATGDFNNSCLPQNPDTRNGKILRIDVDQNVHEPPYYGIPPDNPRAGDPNALDEFFFLGLRNPWRFSFDRATGDMWISDVGEVTREEINHVPFPFEGGLNFGWPMWEGDNWRGSCGGGLPPEGFDELTPPVHTYPRTDGSTIIGGFVYRGTLIPTLRGQYIFGDRGRRRVWAMDPADYSVEELFVHPTGNPVTFGEDREGEIYLGTSGNVWRLIPVPLEVTDHLAVE